jgi:hypothetical protein
MQLNDLAHDRQTQAKASRLPGPFFIDPVEALKNVGQILSGNAEAGIFYPNIDPSRLQLAN